MKFLRIDSFLLKIIVVVFMVFDHLYYNLFPKELFFMHCVSRVCIPVFIYLMTEGMKYTKSQKKYILRIFLFAFIMFIGNFVLYINYNKWIENNIFLSIGISALIIFFINEYKKDKNYYFLLSVIILFMFSFFTEGSFFVSLTAIIFYYIKNKPKMIVTYSIMTILAFLLPFIESPNTNVQIFQILAIIPIFLYNGQRGLNNKFSKYFFYIFYPTHIWIIFLIENHIITGGL